MNLGQRLKDCRKFKKVTQEQLAKELGLNRSTYAKYETGENEPDLETIKKLADYFGVTVDFLANGKPAIETNKTNAYMYQIKAQPIIVAEENTQYTAKDNDEYSLTQEELDILEKIKSDPEVSIFFKDFASAPVRKQKELIKYWKFLNSE